MDDIQKLVDTIADIGKAHPLPPCLQDINAFSSFFTDGNLNTDQLDEMDGKYTRRELMARFLLLNAVLDQGPDLIGVRELLKKVANSLYDKKICIFHRPLDFFKELNESVYEIRKNHESVRNERADEWAKTNQATVNQYNLFMDKTKQELNYAIFRWGVPLALPYILEKNASAKNKATALIDHLEKHNSAEVMSREIKSNPRYGLGKAIGNKACHLYAKWIVSTFSLSRNTDTGWGKYSYEVPYDSNVGRVLWRTGYLLHWADEQAYINRKVIQKKSNISYIRVTNIRNMKASKNENLINKDVYNEISLSHFKTYTNMPQKINIHQIQHVFLMSSGKGVAEFDDGLIHIGHEYCHNNYKPDCKNCPLKKQCAGANEKPELIKNYGT